jgi:hypothetical protein
MRGIVCLLCLDKIGLGGRNGLARSSGYGTSVSSLAGIVSVMPHCPLEANPFAWTELPQRKKRRACLPLIKDKYV